MPSTTKEELRSKLRAKLGNYKISRSSKMVKKQALDKGMKKLNIDKELLVKDIKNCQKDSKNNKIIERMFNL